MPVVFLGDSITQWWDPELFKAFKNYTAINFGVSGHTTKDTLNFLKTSAIWSIKPECVILQIGTNNADQGYTTEETFKDIQEITKTIKEGLPDVKILVIGPLPRGQSKTDRHRVINREINKLLDKAILLEDVYLIDMSYLFINFDETISKKIMYDYLHLTREGYKILTDHISTLLFILFGHSFISE
jgi:lysophospholipase L1-like esterase